jgi:hypothetical protein
LFSSVFIFLRNMSFRFIMVFHKFPKRSCHLSSSFFVCFFNLFFTCFFHLYFKCLVRVLFSFSFLYLIFFHHFGEVFFRFFRFIHFLRTLFAGQKSWKVSSNTFSLRVLPVSVSASGSSRSSRQGVSGARPLAVAQRAAASATAAWNVDMAVSCNVLYMHYIWIIILCKQ